MRYDFSPKLNRDAGITAAIIGAAGAVAASGTNAAMAAKSNRKSRRFAREQYAQQRKDALADWNMQNQYNSPAAQMERLKAAGLNPNLIYGKGADNTAAQIQQSKYGGHQEKAPQVDPGVFQNAGMSFIAARQADQTNKNLQKQEEILESERKLKDAQTLATLLAADWSALNLDTNKKTQIYDVEAKKLAVDSLLADINQKHANTNFTLDQNQRAWAMQQPTLEKAAQEILNLKAGKDLTDEQRRKIGHEINNIIQNNRILKKHADMWEQGINPNATTLERMLQFIYEKIFGKELTQEQVKQYKDEKPLTNPMTGNPNKPFYK